jgi:hypothetical protein
VQQQQASKSAPIFFLAFFDLKNNGKKGRNILQHYFLFTLFNTAAAALVLCCGTHICDPHKTK